LPGLADPSGDGPSPSREVKFLVVWLGVGLAWWKFLGIW
jgi:hypothetical protein